MIYSPLLNRTLAGILIPFIIAIGLVFIQTSGLVERLKGQLESELENEINQVLNDLEFHLNMTTQLSSALAEHPEILNAFENRHNDLLFQWGRRFIDTEMLSRVSFVNSRGIVLARSHLEFSFNDQIENRAVMESVRSGMPLSQVIEEDGIWFFRSTVPIFRYDVVFTGMVVAEKKISGPLLDKLQQAFGFENIILTKGGPPIRPVPGKNLLSMTRKVDFTGVKNQTSLNLTAVKNVRKRMDELHTLRQRVLGLTLFAVLAAGLFIYLSTRHALGPVHRMNTLLDSFQKGEMTLDKLMASLEPIHTKKGEPGQIAGAVIKTLDRIDHMHRNLESMVRDRTAELESKTEQLRREITQRIKAVKDYRLVVENATEAIFLVQDNVIKFPNPMARELFGADAKTLCQKPFTDLIHPMDQEMVMERNQMRLNGGNPPNTFNFRIINADNQELWAQINTVFTLWESRPATLNFIRDITELKKTQETLIQSEKMLSVGGLAAGMAHEINNPLAGMMQNAQMVSKRMTNKIPANQRAAAEAGVTMEGLRSYMEKRNIPHFLSMINDAGIRASEIVTNMLSFARKTGTEKSASGLEPILEKALVLVGNDYDLKTTCNFKHICIEKRYEKDLIPVKCEPSKIQQVVFNIIKNAAEAMAETAHDKDSPPCLILETFQGDDHSGIRIRDNGPGMDESISKRVFEPFFTTKTVDRGTGLGLSISYFIIVEDHGGRLGVESEPGKGTCFTISLPLAQQKSA